MPNLLTLTAPIATANIRLIRIARGPDINEDDNEMTFYLLVTSMGGVVYEPNPRILTVKNGNGCGGIAEDSNAVVGSGFLIDITLRGAGVSSAFSTVLAAMTGPDRRGQALTALKSISGIVVGGPLNGLTRPILPAGAVT